MKTQSIALTLFTVLIAFGLLLFLIQILSKKLKNISENETGLKLSYAFHVSGLLISGSILFAKALPLISEGFEIQWALYKQSFVLEAAQFVATIVGFCFTWFGTLYVVVISMLSVVLGKRDEIIEMERDNFSVFLTKALAFIALSLMTAPLLQNFLRMFMPVLDVAFYH